MTITDELNENLYVVLKDVLTPEHCENSCKRLFELVDSKVTEHDPQCPISDAIYGDPYFDQILLQLTNVFSEISGKTLVPTYSYARIYRPGETLEIHSDRPACQYSATITLGIQGKDWPIFFNKEENIEFGSEIVLPVGSAAFYKGTEIFHWRNKFEGEWQCQVFLHYVDANGPYASEKFDSRPELGLPAETKNMVKDDTVYFWQFPNLLSSDFCDSVVGKYAYAQLEEGLIGGNSLSNSQINKEIRNVKKCLLPIHEGIGAQLIASSFVANQQAWNFDITNCQQVEYLRYDQNGRYKPHIDTFISLPHSNCRKLTALAFLNDNFEGGKFYLQTAEDRIYPVQTKGTIIVFPSFLLHGVEDITAGIRHSVVCWMLGPYFR